MSKLCSTLDIPILSSEWNSDFFSKANYIKSGAADILRADVSWTGGITGALKTAHLAEAFGMNCEIHMTLLSLMDLANLHLALAIKNGEYLGPSLSNQTGYIPPLKSNAIPHSAEADKTISERRPVIVIRFDRQNVEFKQALYSTLSAVLERRPQSTFDLVAIAPNKGTPAEVALSSNTAKGHAQAVMRALAEMGLPSNRVSLASTTSSSVQTNEVRIYAR